MAEIDPIAFSNNIPVQLRAIEQDRSQHLLLKSGLAMAHLQGDESAKQKIAEIDELLARLDKEENLLRSAQQPARAAALKEAEIRAYADKATRAKAALKTIEQLVKKSGEADAALKIWISCLNERQALANALFNFGLHTSNMHAVGRLSHPEAIRQSMKVGGLGAYSPDIEAIYGAVSLEEGDRLALRPGPDLLNLAKDA